MVQQLHFYSEKQCRATSVTSGPAETSVVSNTTSKLFICFYRFLLYCTLAMQTTTSLLAHDPVCSSSPAVADPGFQWAAGGKGAASPLCQSSACCSNGPICSSTASWQGASQSTSANWGDNPPKQPPFHIVRWGQSALYPILLLKKPHKHKRQTGK